MGANLYSLEVIDPRVNELEDVPRFAHPVS
jgi:hypothetical protein